MFYMHVAFYYKYFSWRSSDFTGVWEKSDKKQVCGQRAVGLNPQIDCESTVCVEKANDHHSPLPL